MPRTLDKWALSESQRLSIDGIRQEAERVRLESVRRVHVIVKELSAAHGVPVEYVSGVVQLDGAGVMALAVTVTTPEEPPAGPVAALVP